MQTAQQRILEQIEAQITAAKMTCALSADYANTGSILIYRKFQPTVAVGSVRYHFDRDTFNTTIRIRNIPVPSQVGRADYFDFYQRYDQATRFWEVLAESLTKMALVPAP